MRVCLIFFFPYFFLLGCKYEWIGCSGKINHWEPVYLGTRGLFIAPLLGHGIFIFLLLSLILNLSFPENVFLGQIR